MEKSTPSGLTHKQSRQIAVVDVGQQGPIPVPVHQRTINEHQFLTHPNCRDARSSVRTNEQPNRMRSLSYVDKHDILPIHRLFFASGRTNVRPYWLVRIACGLVRGWHKARPLQLTMVWCGRTNVRPYRLSEFRLKPGIYQGMHVCSLAIVSQSSCGNNPHGLVG